MKKVFELSIPINSKIFDSYRTVIQQIMGEWGGDQTLPSSQFAGLFHNENWKQVVSELTHFKLVLVIYPKGQKYRIV